MRKENTNLPGATLLKAAAAVFDRDTVERILTPAISDMQQEWLEAMMASPPDQSEDFVISFGGETIGKIGAYRLPGFGYILSPRYWGIGLGSEAMAAFLEHYFGRPDATRLTADVDPRNQPSLKLLKRHGFVETGRGTGTWNTHIGPCDSIYLALEKADYRALRRG